jgi:hypothetical protein
VIEEYAFAFTEMLDLFLKSALNELLSLIEAKDQGVIGSG